jgi:hypothetical protein
VLHYAAVSHGLHDRFWSFVRAGNLDAAAQVLSFTQIGLATATGIAISCATIAFSAFHTSTRTPHPFVVAVGLMATLRFRIGIQVMQRLLLTDNTIPSGTDEGLVSVVTGVPEMLLWAVGFAVVIAGWFFIVRGLPQGRRLKTFGAVVVGAAAGAAVYVLGLDLQYVPSSSGRDDRAPTEVVDGVIVHEAVAHPPSVGVDSRRTRSASRALTLRRTSWSCGCW